jgi:hypothetical protein
MQHNMLFPPRAAGRSTFSVLLVLCHVLIACVLATDTVRSGDVTQVPLTECTACRDYGSCDLAFRGHPGQFCHTVLWSGLACCCPQGPVCLSDQSSECLCSTIPQSDDGRSSVVWIYLLIVLVADFYRVCDGGLSSSGGKPSENQKREDLEVVFYILRIQKHHSCSQKYDVWIGYDLDPLKYENKSKYGLSALLDRP